ncbi:response regulator [Carboxylicivirga sp. A043]|uniref:response regulator n=1 Tax=Carboxylicivirga litoralis TaxID=2816963 RepID=UPI0021CB741B|nr:response regulator [Carboxylicivirga sp. A043]MCU4155692.1 response regulator [Carboxylicivirga sp. A043]
MIKILIVDDSFAARMYLANLLDDQGFFLHFAGNGKEALDKIKTYHPDLMIMDLLMPEMDGTEVLRRLRSVSNAPFSIVLSADIQEPTQKRCFELGANAFLAKPVNKQVLIGQIQLLLKNNL